MEEPRRRKLLGPIEIFMLIIGLGILAYVGLQKGSGGIMEQTETIKILDKPNGPFRKAKQYHDPAGEESVERLLQEMADQFSEKENTKKKEPKAIQSRMTKDEEKYFDTVRDRASLDDKIEDVKDWYRLLSASHQTYSKVKEIVGEVTRQPEDRVNPENVKDQLDNQSAEADFYRKLGETFQIDQQDIVTFGQKGKKALSDWADFVEQQSKN